MLRINRRRAFPSRTIVSALIVVVSVATLLILWTQDSLPATKTPVSHPPRTKAVTEPLSDVLPSAGFKLPAPSLFDDSVFPILDESRTYWRAHNQRALKALFQCLSNSLIQCRQNQTKVLILNSYRYEQALRGHTSGEEIWATSTVLALKNMGYTYLYSNTLDHSLQLYQMFPNLVKGIWVEDEDSKACWADDRCILSNHNPSGIPAWKLFTVSFWVQAANPLGRKWTLSPEDYHLEHSHYIPNTYLGYSIEPGCRTRPFIPHELRARPPRAYVFAKNLNYFASQQHAWKADFYDDAAASTGAHFLAGAAGTEIPPDFPRSLENVGIMPQERFYQTLAESAVLVGMGSPYASPTPYDALCLGVPFINPILEWDEHDPTNRDKWSAQHGLLKDLDPPYVYNVFKGDKDGFVKAIKDALTHPIQSYILERMRMGAVEQRLGRILETDWKEEARLLVKERQQSGEGPQFLL
ncbi:hypothetical protein DFH09DRAFT_1431571 [Mycena vulgaris]|nr:hypothetical protein DFH09DRAFT_1431571 [Mycena vulgaris]